MAIIEVVKYDGNPDVFAWKFPNRELGTWTQLIVNESQEAVLYKGGQALDWFGPGRHTLETANIPILNKIINLPFGGHSPFTAEIWYVNKVNALDVKWGTPTPIQLQDPKYNVFVPLRAFGQFGIKISDSKLFLTKLVGTLPTFTSIDIIKYFRGAYLTKVKDNISEYLIKKKISVLEINAYIDEISASLKESILPAFADFGIELVNFYVNDISIPEEDSAVIKLKEALAKKAEMDIIGYSYAQERSFNTLEGAATNQGAGQAGLMGAGMGVGMGLGVGGAMGGAFSEMGKSINTNQNKECRNCNKQIDMEYSFCPFCGKDANVALAESQNTCLRCGTKNNAGLKFCGQCGNSMVKTCFKCGEIVDDNQKFCPHCGDSLLKACSSCGSALSDNLKFCSECGKKVDGDKNE